MTDPIADLLSRIRNAGERRIETIVVPHSSMKEQIAQILKDENFISGFSVETDSETGFKNIVMTLRYVHGKFAIEKLTRVSKPGIRKYVGYQHIPKILGGIGVCILSTSKGIMTGEEAKKQKIGGELVCTIY